jgi:hypothetical protein
MAMERNALNQMIDEMNKVDKLFINDDVDKFLLFEEWLEGKLPYTAQEKYDKVIEDYKKNKDLYK